MLVQAYHHATDSVDSQLAVSRDGLIWQRPERKAIIPLGAPGASDSAQVFSWGSGIAELPDGSWGSLYAGYTTLHNEQAREAHDKAIRWARWGPHRFCGVEAEVEGRFTIPTVTRTANQLKLNYRCRPGGWVKAEILRNIPSRIHPDIDPDSHYFADAGEVGTIGNVAALYAPRSSMAPFHNLRGYGTNGRCRVRLCLSKKGYHPSIAFAAEATDKKTHCDQGGSRWNAECLSRGRNPVHSVFSGYRQRSENVGPLCFRASRWWRSLEQSGFFVKS